MGTMYYVYAYYIAAESGSILEEMYCHINGDDSLLNEFIEVYKED